MDGLQEKLDPLVRRGAAAANVDVYHWELRRLGQRAQLAVQVDRPGGVTVDDCTRASRAISSLLDDADPVPGSYLLEVSSPGVERRLWEPRHFDLAVGKTVRVALRGGETRRGRLARTAEGTVTLDLDGAEERIELADISSAHVVYEQGRR